MQIVGVDFVVDNAVAHVIGLAVGASPCVANRGATRHCPSSAANEHRHRGCHQLVSIERYAQCLWIAGGMSQGVGSSVSVDRSFK